MNLKQLSELFNIDKEDIYVGKDGTCIFFSDHQNFVENFLTA